MRTLALTKFLLGAVCGVLLVAASAHSVARGGPPVDGPPTPYDRDALYPTPVTLYGLFNAGLSKPDVSPQASPCGALAATRHVGIDSVERSRIGLRATELLSGGFQVHMNIEQSLQLDKGELRLPCEPFDARATVGLSDRMWGRVDLGRIEQAASTLVQRADPWRGNGAASPGWRTYMAPAAVGTRSSGTVTYSTPVEPALRATLQLGVPRLQPGQRRELGGSIAWDRLPWLVGIGWHSWSDGSRATPFVVAHDSGTLRVSGALTLGRLGLTEYRNLFVGASAYSMGKGDPQRQEWRVGFDQHRVEGGAMGAWQSDDKLSLGWRYRFSRHSWVAVGAALIKPREQRSHAAFDLSLSYSFERNLRVPQWPK